MSQAMTGDGDYDRHSEYQKRGAASHAELIADAAGRIELGVGRDGVVFVDYGCSQGGSSGPLLQIGIETVRDRYPDAAVFVIQNDLLANDWTTLFDGLRGADSYLAGTSGAVTPLVSAISFYEPVTPPGIVDLGMSFAAIQWLAEPGPPGCGSALYFDQLGPDARATMAAQAHRDWSRFLERRADELAPGGRLVVDMMGVDENGTAAGHDAWALVRTIADELVDEGVLDRARLDAYVFPVYERTLDEVRRAFDEDIGRRLELEHLDIADAPNPLAERFRADGDAEAFARGFVGFFRAFSEPSLREALDPDGRAMDELYRRLDDRIRRGIDDFTFVVHLLTAVIRRS